MKAFKINLSEPVWIKSGYVGETKNPNFTCVLCGDVWAGTHIRINDQLPDGIIHFQKLFWNCDSRGITKFTF